MATPTMSADTTEKKHPADGGRQGLAVRLGSRALRNATLVGPVLLLVAMFVAFSLTTDSFLTTRNLTSVIQNNSVIAILGIGLTMVILLGEIDLAFSGIVLVTGASTGLFFTGTAVSIPLIGAFTVGGGGLVQTLVTLLVGLLLGLLVGWLVGKVAVPSLIASLAVLLLAQGLAVYWLNGQAAFDFPDWVLSLGHGKAFGIPKLAWCAAAVALVVHLLLSRTIFGRHIYMAGANRNAARLSGINTTRLVLMVFAISGLIGAIAGICYAGNFGSVNAESGKELLLPTFAAVVLGGNSLLGGSGGVKNTVVGVLIFAVLDNGLLLLDIDVFLRPLMQGLLLVVAVMLNVGLSRLAAYANRQSSDQTVQSLA
ncbi:ABC transporter permease [Nocardioides agariphilus]|uniref:ABC transporter permease n=1 Tax=Nocardioides agariphilus TaxID=433664 RepID=A0A930VK38_9ACTN|nr:ABC transporter permease [Nocardioides agariphilus]MBF4766205.1 ABC transporter permease [Nocardioides agariphilus]